MNKTVTVRGSGRIALRPDLTEITLTVRSKDKSYENAVSTAAVLLEGLRSALEGVGFDREALKTVSFNVNTEYEGIRDPSGNYRNVFSGYCCTHGLRLEFDFDTRRLSEVLSAVAGCVAEPELNVRFTVRDREAAADALLKSAAENAASRARVLADACGARLGQLLNIEYGTARHEMYSPTNYAMDGRCMAKACAADVSVTPEDVTLSDDAVFVWELL